MFALAGRPHRVAPAIGGEKLKANGYLWSAKAFAQVRLMRQSAKTFAHPRSEIKGFDELPIMVNAQLPRRDIEPCQHILPG